MGLEVAGGESKCKIIENTEDLHSLSAKRQKQEGKKSAWTRKGRSETNRNKRKK